MEIAVIAIVARCGVLIAWPNGLHRDKINKRKMFGCNKSVLVQCVEQHFVY